MSKYKTGDYIKFDTPEQREQIVQKLESEGYCIRNAFVTTKYNLLRFRVLDWEWRAQVEEYAHNCNITDKFWDEYEAEQDLTICLEGAYCPRYYKVEFTVDDYLKNFKYNPDYEHPKHSTRPFNGVITLVIDVKTKSTHIPSFLESAMASILHVEISTESGTNLSDELLYISGSTEGLVAKAKDIDNYNKWLDSVKFNRSQEFKILTEGFEESLEIIDSLYK